MAKKKSTPKRSSKWVKTLGVASVAAAVGLPALPAEAGVGNIVIGGAGIFFSWGSGFNWGFQVQGSSYLDYFADMSELVFTGGSLQVHFMDKTNK